jgi:hypothetical protein
MLFETNEGVQVNVTSPLKRTDFNNHHHIDKQLLLINEVKRVKVENIGSMFKFFNQCSPKKDEKMETTKPIIGDEPLDSF